jgi:hypothetical protein
MYNVSTNFLVLMSYEFMNGKGIGWDNAETLEYLKIPCRPSSNKSDHVPPHLTKKTAGEISDLIAEVGGQSSVDKARKFVEQSKSPTGQAAYKEWYRAYASRQLNRRMNAAMAAAQNTIPDILRRQEDDTFPITHAFSSNDIGVELIGNVICNGLVLSNKASPLVNGLITATLGRVRKTYNKGQTVILGKKIAGGREVGSSMWLKTDLLMKGEFTVFPR